MKELILKVFNHACRLAFAIFTFSSCYVGILNGPNDFVLLSYVWGILGISVVMAIGWIPFMGEKELSKNQMFFGKLLYFIITNIVVFVEGYYLHWFCFESKISVICLEACVIFVLIAMNLGSYIANKREANKMTEILRKRGYKPKEED